MEDPAKSIPEPDRDTASVLVYVGLDRVGDSLLKLPFVRGLRAAFPEARITWVAGKETSVYATVMAPAVEGLIDEVIENAGIGARPLELLRGRPLGGRAFDLVIDTQKIVWTTLSLRRIPHRRFVSPAAGFRFSSVKPPRGYTAPRSMQRQLFDLLELASGRPFSVPLLLGLRFEPEVVREARELLPDGPEYIGFAPGSGGLPKCWPLANFIGLARDQAVKGRTPVFFMGPAERDRVAAVRAAVPEALLPLQEPGVTEKYRFSPWLTIQLAGRLAASVSNDSGAGHMLAVGGRPLVSLFGPTVPEKFMPMSEHLTILRAETFGGREMERIPYEAVRDALEAAVVEGRFG